MIAERPAHSYRRDPVVPSFDDGGPIAFMDGTCLLCTAGARLIAKLDRAEAIRICPIQSPLGRALLAHYEMDADDPTSWLLLADGLAFTSLDGMIQVGRRVGGIGHLIRPLGLLPRRTQDWLYLRVARNRYRLFGRADLCAIADPGLRRRLMG